MRQLSLSIAYVVFLTYRQEQEVVGLFHYVVCNDYGKTCQVCMFLLSYYRY